MRQYSLASLMGLVTVVAIFCAVVVAWDSRVVLLAIRFALATAVAGLALTAAFFAVLYAVNAAVWLFDRTMDRFA
jgi:hypothetical protein